MPARCKTGALGGWLVFTLTDTQSPLGDQVGQALCAVDREGKEPALRLFKRSESFVVERSSRRELSAFHLLHAVLRDGSDDVIEARRDFDPKAGFHNSTLLRLNTLTGQARPITLDAPERAQDFARDAQGVPRVAMGSHKGKIRLHWKPTPDAPWSFLREFKLESYDFVGGLVLGRGGGLLGVRCLRGRIRHALVRCRADNRPGASGPAAARHQQAARLRRL